MNGGNILFGCAYDTLSCSLIEAYNIYDKSLKGVICLLIILTNNILVSSFNTNGIGSRCKRLAVAKWLRSFSQKIVFLQECQSTPGLVDQFKQDFETQNIFLVMVPQLQEEYA